MWTADKGLGRHLLECMQKYALLQQHKEGNWAWGPSAIEVDTDTPYGKEVASNFEEITRHNFFEWQESWWVRGYSFDTPTGWREDGRIVKIQEAGNNVRLSVYTPSAGEANIYIDPGEAAKAGVVMFGISERIIREMKQYEESNK